MTTNRVLCVEDDADIRNFLKVKLGHSDFEVVAISLDENRDDALAFLKKIPLTFPLLHDPESNSARAYGLKGMPSSYLIDRHGVLRSVHIGFQMKDLPMLKQKIADLVIEPEAERAADVESPHAD